MVLHNTQIGKIIPMGKTSMYSQIMGMNYGLGLVRED